MPESPEIRQELAQERRELKEAVAALREEIDEKTQQGKKLAAIVGVAAGAAVLTNLALKLTSRSR
jgi:cell division septum initiation protein DivIVA